MFFLRFVQSNLRNSLVRNNMRNTQNRRHYAITIKKIAKIAWHDLIARCNRGTGRSCNVEPH
ncbi:hypothetical protein KPLM21_820003 [Klebsiella pneumoniae]|nr:hypothetical protein KPLM21_820003 [Klebsiella pneumoniae]